MKKITTINASPRIGWNTGSLIGEMGLGAKSEGVEIKVIDFNNDDCYLSANIERYG